MFIIPQKVLNELICSVCSKYLSVKPVKVYRSRIIKCGRCSSDDDDDGVVSLYNKIIENGLFPCVNRFEGCNQLMNSSEVAAHEKNCVSRTYKCPICCLENEFSSSLQLLRHYENNHGKEVLEKPAIVTNAEREFQKYFLYKKKNFIFIIYLRCDTLEKCFLFNVACLGPKERVENILQNVKCYLNDDDKNCERLFFQSENRRCSIFEKNADSFKIAFPNKINFVTLNFNLNKSNVDHFNYIKIDKKSSSIETKKIPNFGLRNKYPKIYLSDEYKKKNPYYILSPCETKLFDLYYEKEVFPRVCHFCENIFQKLNSFKIFKCSCDHFYCSDCYDIFSYCHKESKLSPFEMSNCDLLRFYCKWNCGAKFPGNFLIEHEDTCKENCDAQYDLRILTEKHFGSDLGFTENSFVSRTNVFSAKDYDFRTQNQNIFVITRDNFKFVLHSNYENEEYKFSVSHDYPTDKYHILFKVKESNHEIYHFYSSVNNFICYDQGSFSFVVLLKEISNKNSLK